MPRYWTKKEDQYLLDNWFEPITILAEKLKTSDGVVSGRLKKLGIERPKGKEANMVLRASIYRDKNKEKVPKDWQELPLTRKEAKEKKSFFYWDGQTCKREGHLSKRKTSSGGCWECDYGDHKDRFSKDPEFRKKRQEMFKRYYDEKGEEFLERQRERKNTDKFRAWARKYGANQRKDIDFRLTKSLRDRLYRAITREIKYDSAIDLVGCSIEELKDYLSKQFSDNMNWNNYGQWHIDHIRPCNSFDLRNKEQQKICFYYFNLQPLWGTENHAKKDSYSERDEKLWIKRMKDLGYEGKLFLKYQQKKD